MSNTNALENNMRKLFLYILIFVLQDYSYNKK